MKTDIALVKMKVLAKIMSTHINEVIAICMKKKFHANLNFNISFTLI